MYHGYTVIDAHAHIFPDKIAERATDGISQFYDLPMSHQGSMGQLLDSGDRAGMDGYLVCSTATNPAQTEAINSFIGAPKEKSVPEWCHSGACHCHRQKFPLPDGGGCLWHK